MPTTARYRAWTTSKSGFTRAGQSNMQRVIENDSYRESFELYLEACRGDVWTIETKAGTCGKSSCSRPSRQIEEEDLRGGRQPPESAGRAPGRRRRFHSPGAETHRAGATHRFERLRLRPPGMQSRDCLFSKARPSRKERTSYIVSWACPRRPYVPPSRRYRRNIVPKTPIDRKR